MRAVFEAFLTEMVHDVPSYIYVMLFILLCLVFVLSIIIVGWKKSFKFSIRFALAEYIFLLYSSTVFFRPSTNNTGIHLVPFWSYAAYDSIESPSLLPEIIMNIVVFVPFGFLLVLCFKNLKWWMVMLFGLCISVSIEVFQYIFKLGVSEFDDVFHNCLGCVIGCGMLKLRMICKKKDRMCSMKTLINTFILMLFFPFNLLAQAPVDMNKKMLPVNRVDGINVLTPGMLHDTNTIYIIQNNYELDKDLTVPANCVLIFDGGSISGKGKIVLNGTILKGNPSITSDFAGTIGNESINVNWFGIAPNTKCQERFQKVIDLYASSVPSNSWDFWPDKPEPKIVIPNGIYEFGNIAIRSYLTIEGQGTGGTILQNSFFKGCEIYNVRLSNLVFRNSKKAVNSDAILLTKDNSYKIAIEINHGSFVAVENVAIQNYDIGVYLNRCYTFETNSCQIKYCSIGLQAEGPTYGDACHALNIYGGVITSYNYGIVINKGFGINIGRTSIEGGNYGIYSKDVGSINIFNNYFEKNKVADLSGVFYNTSFYNNFISNSGKTTDSYYIYATKLMYCSIYDNLFSQRNPRSTIPYIELAKDVKPERVSIYGNDVGGTHTMELNEKLKPNCNIGDGFIPGDGSWPLNPGGNLSVYRNTTFGNLLLRLNTAQGSLYFKGDKSTRSKLVSDYNTRDLDASAEGDGFYNTKENKPVWWDGTAFREYDGAVAGVKRSGIFKEKPSADKIYIGYKYFCTDRKTVEGKVNGIEIIHKGNNVWVDALGRQVK